MREFIKKLNVILNNRYKNKKNRGKTINCNNNNEGGDKIEIGTEKDIPGPISIPLFGTKWIYFWRYKMTKIHETYKGNFFVVY